MTKKILCAAVAMVIMAAAPTLAQCGKTCGTDKPKCGTQAKSGGCTQAKTCSADGKTCSATGSGCSKDGKSGCEQSAACASAAGIKGLALPRMVYQVGDKRMTCPKSAAALAETELKTVKYVVADKVYEEKTEAVAAHADVLNKFLDESLKVKFAVGDKCVGCPNAAKAMARSEQKSVGYRVASFDFAEREVAEKASQAAREAAGKVKMKVMVGEQAFCCPTEATVAAKQQGKKIDYCVGEMKTACQATAKLELAKARIKAALAACEQCGGKQVAVGA